MEGELRHGSNVTATLDIERSIPMRWPCGPQEIEAARRLGTSTREELDALERWCDPLSLDILERTPVSCLVLPWATGGPGDAAHQQALAPLTAAARRRGLGLVGWAGKDADPAIAARAAHAAGLDAVATVSTAPGPAEVLRFRDRDSGDHSPATFLGVTGAAWPGLRASAGDGVDAWSGPTGPPWIDSNAWSVRLLRTLVGPTTLWLSFDPPSAERPIPAGPYVKAIADAAIHGARWVVSLDSALRRELVEGKGPARETWEGIARALSFFEAHRDWAGYDPVGLLGVVSTFAGDDAFMSREVLNLLARQGSLFRILEKGRAASAPLDGLEAILYVDHAAPGPELRRRLYAFAEAGGTLVTPPGWERKGARADDAWTPRFEVFRHGRGRLAVAREEPSDPQRLAEDAQLLMSHRHDPVRLFNSGTAVSHYCTSRGGDAGVLHVVSWGGSLLQMPVTAWFRRPWATGATWRVESPGPLSTERARVESGVEFYLPPVPVYSALEVSG